MNPRRRDSNDRRSGRSGHLTRRERDHRHGRGPLPNYLKPGLRILFVGINPGLRSASMGHHFAGYSNRFWTLLFDSRLIPEPLTFADDWRLTQFGLGLTNMIARSSRSIETLQPREFRVGRVRLLKKVRRFRPQIVALLGVTLLPVLIPDATAHSKTLGMQPYQFGGSQVWLLPNPSGRNAHYTYAQMLRAYRRLRAGSLLSRR